MKKEPLWKERFKEQFGKWTNFKVEVPKGYELNGKQQGRATLADLENWKDWSLVLEEFMNTVYNEGLRDSKCKLCLFWYKTIKTFSTDKSNPSK
ncbi:MAG: hypothetical protein ABR875_00170 [Minisyncoccia bacterium]|jgi:hypothetical protein